MRPLSLNTRPRPAGADPLEGYVKEGLLLFYDGILNWQQTGGDPNARFIDQSGNGNHSLPVTEIPSYKTWGPDGFSSVETDTTTSGRGGVVIPQSLAEQIATRRFTTEGSFRINENVYSTTQNTLLMVGGNFDGFRLTGAAFGNISAVFGVGSASTASGTGSASQSYVLAGTCDGETIRSYQNGNAIASRALSNTGVTPTWTTLPFYLGQNAASNNLGVKGTTRTCRIYNRPLTPAELAQNAARDIERYAPFAAPKTLMATRAPAFSPDFDPIFDLSPEES